MDLNKAIELGQLLTVAANVRPEDLTSSAGTTATIAGGGTYTVVTTIYANDLATDMNPERGNKQVSIGLVWQANGSGDVVITIRGTSGIDEWLHDAEFLQVTCPFLPGAGETEDGFTAMYNSLRASIAPGAPPLVAALATLPFAPAATSITICGHSLGGALATLLALDTAANTGFKDPTLYTYASPRTGNPSFADTFNQVVKNSFRIANRIDLVPKLPLPPDYDHTDALYELNPIQLLPFPPKILVRATISCEHALNSYLYLLSLAAGGPIFPLDSTCAP
jgi:pimeloyl-ACP methyl ester carboxylesterase